jgi:hypothetical protein
MILFFKPKRQFYEQEKGTFFVAVIPNRMGWAQGRENGEGSAY